MVIYIQSKVNDLKYQNNNDKIIQSLHYDMLYSGKISEITEVATTLITRLKGKDNILEEAD